MIVKISCISLPEEMTCALSVKEKLQKAIDLVDMALLDKPDLVCLPEAFAQYFLPCDQWSRIQESLEGEIVTTVAKRAKAGGAYIICPILLRDGKHIKNTAVLLGRSGEYIGRYEKQMPTIEEIGIGVRPGSSGGTFQTDFGTIGLAICFDLNFWEVGRRLEANGVKAVFFPSMYEGGFQLQQWAFEFQCYVASSVLGGASSMINPFGQVQARSSRHQAIISRTIFTDYVICHLNGHFEKLRQIKEKFGPEIHIDITTPEAKCMIASARYDIKIRDVVRDFGLESFNDYMDRSRKICVQARQQ